MNTNQRQRDAQATQHTPGELHLPLPDSPTWRQDSPIPIVAEDGFVVVSITRRGIQERQANARRIVTAWNAHDDLLAVCEKINALRSVPGGIGDDLGGLGDWLEDAINKAKGGTS